MKIRKWFWLVVILVIVSGIIFGGRYYLYYYKPKEALILAQVAAPCTIWCRAEDGLFKSWKRARPLAKYLEKKLGRKTKFLFAPDYPSLIKRMKTENYDLVLLDARYYVTACRETDYSAILRPIFKRRTARRSIIIVRADSGMVTIRDLREKSFAFGREGSPFGHLYPKVLILRNGVDPERDFSSLSFTRGDEEVVKGVFGKRFIGGACRDDARRNTFKELRKINQLRIIAKTPPIPTEPWVVRKDLDQKLVDKISEVFIRLSETEEGRRIMEIFSPGKGIEGYVRTKNEDYDVIRSMERLPE